jgi:hypothetical protein
MITTFLNKKIGKYNALRLINTFAMIIAPFFNTHLSTIEEGGGTAEEQKLLEKIQKKNEEQLNKFRDEFKKLSDDSRQGLITEEEFAKKFNELSEKLKDFDSEKYKKFIDTLTEMSEKLKAQGTEITKLKDGGVNGDKPVTLKSQLYEIAKSEKFSEFIASGGKKKVEFQLKTVSVTSDYTGTSLVHITTRDPRVVDHPQVTRLNIRDLLTVAPADLPYLAYMEVYSWSRAVTTTGENTALAESSFKVREATSQVKRIGTHVPISKTMLRSSNFVANHLAQRLPAQVKYYEDFQLLWGDGAGNNLTGIFKTADDFATVINTSITGVAGDVTSIATYDGGTKTLVTLTANELINNGDVITFASTTGGTYDNAYTAIVISPTQLVIEQAYTADANVLANWTFTVNSHFKTAIEAAQRIDVLKVAKTLVTQQEYTCNGFILNPVDATLIETTKGTDEHYIEVMRDGQGILRVSGIPVVETTAMPAGKFAVGDWAMAAALYEFTTLTLEFSESTTEKLGNYVEAIIQEELLFPIYNKYMFVVGDFTTAIAAIKAGA